MNFIKKYFINKEIKKLERLRLHRFYCKEKRSWREWTEVLEKNREFVFYKESDDEKKLTDKDILIKSRKLTFNFLNGTYGIALNYINLNSAFEL